MKVYKLTESEEKFAELIWKKEPLGSGEHVKICEKEMNWKKSTSMDNIFDDLITFTFIFLIQEMLKI